MTWWDQGHRELPWRESKDFYRVWLSEIMLQQTRVEAVKPYFDQFLEKFPTLADLAAAPEPAVLAAWSGLGYYSRARNLHQAAKKLVLEGIPTRFEQILSLPGVGPYTAAAVASISLGIPKAAVDGNVIRVISRLENDPSEITSGETQRRFALRAAELLDHNRPGDFNQAMMELGATVCTPRSPTCLTCPVSRYCLAKEAGTQNSLPVKLRKAVVREMEIELLLLQRSDCLWLKQRAETESRLAGFWEFPELDAFQAENGKILMKRQGRFTHQIVNDRMQISVWHSTDPKVEPQGGQWVPVTDLAELPLTTVSKKALAKLNLAKVR